MSKPIVLTASLKASPSTIYAALTEATKFSALTGGAPATIANEAGGAFTLFGGMISGRAVELAPGQRVVQAWRTKAWPEGVYSLVHFELRAEGSGTQLSLTHSAYPEDQAEHLAQGWKAKYLEPLQQL